MGRDFNQIKTPLFGIGQGLLGINNPDLLSGITDEPDLRNPYLTIDSYFFSSYGEPPDSVAFSSSFKWEIKLSALIGSRVSPCLRKRGATVWDETS